MTGSQKERERGRGLSETRAYRLHSQSAECLYRVVRIRVVTAGSDGRIGQAVLSSDRCVIGPS